MRPKTSQEPASEQLETAEGGTPAGEVALKLARLQELLPICQDIGQQQEAGGIVGDFKARAVALSVFLNLFNHKK